MQPRSTLPNVSSPTRIEEGMPARAGEPTYAAFKAIHFHLFQDLYAWAGQERTYTTGRGPTPFAPPEQIAPWMEKQFAAFRELKGLSAEGFAVASANFITEINAAHPFIEGNGRTQRIWLGGVAERAGLNFGSGPRTRRPGTRLPGSGSSWPRPSRWPS
ncbi:hypothetical protein CSW63_01405 (plasmid) [Caulobacter sp. FWC26]|nr:hypothetical protein CSW63_01405 [Caulobacter sp. FWC26]